MNRQPTLTGDRLLLQPLRADDWDALYAVASDPLIWELHPAHDRWQEPVFHAYFANALAHGGAVAVIDRASGAMVGSSRWQGHDPAEGGSVEIGWTFLARSLWGGSVNRELKRLMLAHAFEAVTRVDFRVGASNLRSVATRAHSRKRSMSEHQFIWSTRWPPGLRPPISPKTTSPSGLRYHSMWV